MTWDLVHHLPIPFSSRIKPEVWYFLIFELSLKSQLDVFSKLCTSALKGVGVAFLDDLSYFPVHLFFSSCSEQYHPSVVAWEESRLHLCFCSVSVWSCPVSSSHTMPLQPWRALVWGSAGLKREFLLTETIHSKSNDLDNSLTCYLPRRLNFLPALYFAIKLRKWTIKTE